MGFLQNLLTKKKKMGKVERIEKIGHTEVILLVSTLGA